jgi:hypothetical protein
LGSEKAARQFQVYNPHGVGDKPRPRSRRMPPRRRPKFTGLFHDDVVTDSYWIREEGRLALPPLHGVRQLAVIGEVLPTDPTDPTSAGKPGLRALLDDREVAANPALPAGPFRFDVPLPAGGPPAGGTLTLRLTGVTGSNLLAWLGRVTGLGGLQAWRRQARNRRLRIARIEADGEVLFDFANRASPWNTAFARRFLQTGLNVTGYFRADLGITARASGMANTTSATGHGSCQNFQTHGSTMPVFATRCGHRRASPPRPLRKRCPCLC